MRTITKEDLENVFLLVIRMDRSGKEHLPLVRRAFKSVVNACKKFHDRPIDIFYSGVFIAHKKANDQKAVMARDFKSKNENYPFLFT